MNKYYFPGVLLLCCLALCACQKWQDKQPPEDPRINEKKYCNDPYALNYNWDFPGMPDSTVCIYPADIFEGNYLFTDSLYSADNTFDSAASQQSYALRITRLSINKLAVHGFCSPTDSLLFTAERSTFRANADSTIQLTDTTTGYGQFFCRTQDTLSGFMMLSRTDSTLLKIDFTVVSDTDIRFHRGTAIRQL